MPKVQQWPYEVHSMDDKKINFKQISLTVDEANPAKDGTSKAGNEYHLPPRVSFAEDPEREDWMWKAWNDDAGRYEDFSGDLPVAGDVVQVKLKASYKGGEDSGEFYFDIHDLYVSGTSAAAPQPNGAAPQSASSKSALGRLTLDEKISAVAMSNVLLPLVWAAEPDGDEWKELIRSAVKKIGVSQIPPSLLGIAKETAETKTEEPPAEAATPPQDDDVEELPW